MSAAVTSRELDRFELLSRDIGRRNEHLKRLIARANASPVHREDLVVLIQFEKRSLASAEQDCADARAALVLALGEQS